eukprot:CAMPEP_0197183946 /NCGR_PEP_ID=MMETSP1423-20130617/8841_1 /TAXON_ID=476441 /ORGANISM="Pseudo-nitzschia heimii, Strain UNC1101" /LENGTH=241 /DNA_ID=CAMNT_0042634633 /DNA_START=66 /DNA_END=788 /DNA_ORIENTATION=+
MARKKTEKSSTRATPGKTRDSSSSKETASKEQKLTSMNESVERAQIAVETSQRQMLSLHRAWRSQLLRMSFLVLMLVLKQASKPSYDCMEKIKEWNGRIVGTESFGGSSDGNNSLFITQWEAAKYCISDSLMEIFSVLCCLSFIWLLYQPLQGNDFSSRPFRFVAFSVPLIIASYHRNPTLGCIGDLDGKNNGGIENVGVAYGKPRSFPVVLILLLVGFVSLYIMDNQQRQQRDNVEKVEK